MAMLGSVGCGHGGDAWIDGFSGWASSVRGGRLYARVHTGTAPEKPRPGESSYARLKETIEALDLRPLGGATVSVVGVAGLATATADTHGFVELALPPGLPPGVTEIKLTVATAGYAAASTTIPVEVWDDSPGIGVISDIDDTLTDTGVTHKLKMIENTLLHSTWELKTFPGAPETVAALAGSAPGGLAKVPVFYLSGSPWALHGRIAEFFARAGFPRGSMILRRYSQESVRDPAAFKYPHLKEILAAFPNRRWVLLGDSGEKDPEVYRQIRAEAPGQIAAEYIHLVTGAPAGADRFSGATKVEADWRAILEVVRANPTGTTP